MSSVRRQTHPRTSAPSRRQSRLHIGMAQPEGRHWGYSGMAFSASGGSAIWLIALGDSGVSVCRLPADTPPRRRIARATLCGCADPSVLSDGWHVGIHRTVDMGYRVQSDGHTDGSKLVSPHVQPMGRPCRVSAECTNCSRKPGTSGFTVERVGGRPLTGGSQPTQTETHRNGTVPQ